MLRVAVVIQGEDDNHFWTLKNGTLRYSGAKSNKTDGELSLSRATLLALYAGANSWDAAIGSGLVEASGAAESLVEVFDSPGVFNFRAEWQEFHSLQCIAKKPDQSGTTVMLRSPFVAELTTQDDQQ